MVLLKLSKAGFGLAFVSLATCIVAIAIPYWSTHEETMVGTRQVYTAGLWRTCTKFISSVGETTICTPITPQGWLNTTRGVEIFGMLLILICIFLLAVHFRFLADVEAFQMIASFLACTAGLFTLLGAVIYAHRFEEYIRFKDFQLHAGFWLAMLSTILNFVTAILLVIGRLCASKYS